MKSVGFVFVLGDFLRIKYHVKKSPLAFFCGKAKEGQNL